MMKKSRSRHEHEAQTTFFDWVRLNRKLAKHPDLRAAMKLCYANINGASLSKKRDKRGNWYSPEGKYLKAEGMTSGVLDVNLDWPVFEQDRQNNPFILVHGIRNAAGLRLEFKHRRQPISRRIQEKIKTGNYIVDLTLEQKETRELLLKAGYQVAVVYSAAQAIRTVFEYLPFQFEDYQGKEYFNDNYNMAK